jgi:hypothetical protein
MPSAATAAKLSVVDIVHLFDGPFSGFAEGVAEDRYALWLGSGISFGRVDGLKKVVPRVIEFLRVQISGTPTCRFQKALKAILKLAPVSSAEDARCDFSKPYLDWPDAAAITDRLVSKYSQMLNIEVDGEAEDFLLWNGADVVGTYAKASLDPDIEHICIAILILEGVASEITSANWDGLIEIAVAQLAGGKSALSVCVRSEDLRGPLLKSHLYKIHGCAVKAGENEATYRPYLIARQPQISSWRTRPEHKALVEHVVHLATIKPTLMMGLSAQDPNIQAAFAESEATMNWPWPGERPSCVFSNEELGADHKAILQNVYRDTYNISTRDQIAEGALIRAYAKPLLEALVLHVICSKFQKLVELAPETLAAPEQRHLHQGLLIVRDIIADKASTDNLKFIKSYITQSSRAISLFRDGRAPTTPDTYSPITPTPIQQIALDTSLSSSGLTEAAIAAGILGLGFKAGHWTLQTEDIANFDAAVITLKGTASSAKIFFVMNSHVAVSLQHNGHVTDIESTILIHSKERVPLMARSSSGAIGRTGKAELREVSISSLLGDVTTADELMQRFREEIAI